MRSTLNELNELIEAASELLHAENRAAERSYREYNGSGWTWNDSVWERYDPEGLARVQRLRAALAAMKKARLLGGPRGRQRSPQERGR